MDPMILAAAAVIVIGAIATAAVAIIKQLQAIKLGNAEIKTGNDGIHKLVNSAAEETARKIAALEATIAAQHAAMTALQAQRVADAQTQAAQSKNTGAVAP